MNTNYREGLRIARFLMVLCSFSPLFILWAIGGTKLIPDRYFITGCFVFAVLPNIFAAGLGWESLIGTILKVVK
jgi:hypothetical protein